MAYSAPELLLVGAAQNLVLFTSPEGNQAEPCLETEKDDSTTYDAVPLW